MQFAIADQVGAPKFLQCLSQGRPVIGVVIPEKCLVQNAAETVLLQWAWYRCCERSFFRGFLPLWYIAVALAIGEG